MADVALSTMWGIGKFDRVAGFIEAGQAMGFTRFELNHAVDSKMLEGLNRNGYQIPSIHEPCPADISTGELKDRNWLVSAPDESDRERGVAAIRHSIDLARELGAQVVIVHPGRVDIPAELDQRLAASYRAGQFGTPAYEEHKSLLVQARAAQAEVNMESVCKSLRELGDYARRQGVRLGLENRYHYFEIPLPDELERLLNPDYHDVIGYWHDVGHAQALEHLGFMPHREWLERFGSRIIGVHLHDLAGIDDHRAAGLGVIDYEMVARYLPQDALRTLEFQGSNTPAQVTAGRRLLIDKKCVRE